MTHQEATYINMLILIVLGVSACIQITMVLWLVCLVRELRGEIRSQILGSVNLASARDEIRLLRAREPGEPLTHTDDHGP
jgi:hypothetical protein